MRVTAAAPPLVADTHMPAGVYEETTLHFDTNGLANLV